MILNTNLKFSLVIAIVRSQSESESSKSFDEEISYLKILKNSVVIFLLCVWALWMLYSKIYRKRDDNLISKRQLKEILIQDLPK